MTWLEAIILAIVQGLAEFLPISSSGHLSLFEHFFGISSMDNMLLYDVMLHMGTLIAVFFAFFTDIRDMVAEFFRLFTKNGRAAQTPPARRMILLIIIGSLPLLVVVFFKDAVEQIKQMPVLIGAALMLTGVVLFLADRIRAGRKDEKTARASDALFVGLMQALATVPGLSRSGMTISGGLFRGFSRQFALRFSFLMSIPAVIAATVLESKDAIQQGVDPSLWPMILVGMVVAAVVGYAAIGLLKRMADKGKFGVFAVYCLLAGAASIIFFIVQG